MTSFRRFLTLASAAVLATAVFLGARPAAATTNYAVCVGINLYTSGDDDTLYGCVNDAHYFYTNLVTRGGWSKKNMTLLTDSAATLSAIRSAITSYASKAVAGDTFIYQHSSHGCYNYPDYSSDIYSVCLCTHEYYYEDTELAEDLAKFKTGVKVVVVVDACHSGGLFKDASSSRKDFNLAARVTEIMDENRAQRLARGERGVEKGLSASEIGWVTAAEYDESSLDGGYYDTSSWMTSRSSRGDVQGGVFLGSFTWAWWNGTCDTKSGYGDNDGYADAYECWRVAYECCTNFGKFRYNDSSANFTPQCTNIAVLRSVELGWVGDSAPNVAPQFSSSTATASGYKGDTISFDFSSLLTAGAPAPSYSISPSVSGATFTGSTLTFTPSASGTFTFTCTASNTAGSDQCVLTVTVMLPPPETPSEVSQVGSDSFTATWSPVTGASTYELLVVEGAASGGASGPFTLVTSSSGLTAGEYVILADGIDRAMNNNCNGDSSGVLSYEDVTVDNSTITTDEASIIWTLAGNADSCTLFNAAAGKYVNPATARNVGWSANASGAWTLSLNNDVVTVANAANTSWMLQYNSGSPRFALYDNNNQKKLRFFRRNASRALPRAVGDVVYSNTVGNVTSFSVTGLQPETTYSYSVRAIVNGEPTGWSDSVSVTTTEGNAAPVWSDIPVQTVTVGATCTLDLADYLTGSPTPTISMAETVAGASLAGTVFTFTPTVANNYTFTFTATNSEGTDSVTVTVTVSAAAVTIPTLEVDDCTDTTAYALWDACTGVSTYTLQLASDNQFTTGGAGAAVLEADFSDTSDWTLSGTGTYVNSPLYGNSSPALAFKNTGHYAISPEFSGGTKLTFWAYGNATSGTASTFAISGLVNGSWTAIETVEIAIGADTYEVNLPSGTTQFRFDFTKNGYNCALDDVVVTGASGSGSLIATYTVNDTEYTFTGLTPNTTYYARVQGNDAWSEVKSFTTEAGADSAPEWSAIPAQAVTVGETCTLDLSGYVNGSPAPSITMAETVAGASLTGTVFSFTPASIDSFEFTFTANNGIGSPASATLTVTSTGTPPAVIVPQTSCSTSLGGADVDFYVTATGTPTPTLALSDTTATSGYDFDPDDGYFTFIPYATGTFTFTFTATSLAGSNSVTVTVTVTDAAVTVPTLTVTNVTDTTALATWTACDGVTSYTLQLASDDQFTTGGSGGEVTLFSNDATDPSAAPDGWTYNLHNTSGSYLQLMSGNYVVTEAFDASACTDLSLSLYMRTYGGTTYPSVTVEYSTDGGTTWSEPLGTLSAANTTMAERSLDVSDAAGASSVRLRIASTSTSSSVGVGIKTIVLTGTEVSGSGSLISSTTVADTEYTFTGLTPETTYFARVKGTSDWSNVATFTTPAGADSAPVWSAIPAQNYLFGSNNGTFEFNVAPYASGSPAPAFYLGDTQWTAYMDDGNGDFIFEPEALGTFDFTVIASNTLGTANATLSVTVTAAPPAFVDLPSTVTGYAGEDVAFTVVATGNPAPVLAVDADDGILYSFDNTTGVFEFISDNTGDFEFEFTAANIAAIVTQTVTVTISPAPVTVPVLTVTNVTDTTALATWTACDGVSSYTLQLSTNDFPAASGASARSATPILAENFSGVEGASSTAISDFDSVMGTNGWSGTFVYPFNGAVRLGKGSGAGSLQTPAIEVGENVRVAWSACWWTNDSTKIYVGVSTDNGTTFDETEVQLSGDMTAYTTNFTVTGSPAIVRWRSSAASNQRFFLDDIAITTFGDEPAGDDIQEFPVADTSYQFTGLTPYTVYYARVKGNAEWSNVEQFITEEEPVSGTAPSWSALPDDASVVADGTYELDLSTYVSGDAPITFTLAETELEADVVDSNFIFYPAATGTFTFTFTAENASGSATATLIVTATGEAPAITVTPATYSYEVNVGDPYVEFTVTASGHPVPTLTDSCTEGAFYVFENNTFLFEPDTAGTYHFVFTASNSEGEDSKTVTVTVSGGEPPLTAFQQWLADNGYGEHAEGDTAGNGQTYFENYIADIDPRTTNELAIVFSNGQFIVNNASVNRYYQFIYSTNLMDGFTNTDDLGKPTSTPLVLDAPEAANWFGRIKVTVEDPTP